MAPPGKDALLIIKACDRGEPGFAASRERTGRHGVESFGVMDSAIFAAETSPGDADGTGLAQNGRRGDTERAGPQVSAYPAGMSPGEPHLQPETGQPGTAVAEFRSSQQVEL